METKPGSFVTPLVFVLVSSFILLQLTGVLTYFLLPNGAPVPLSMVAQTESPSGTNEGSSLEEAYEQTPAGVGAEENTDLSAAANCVLGSRLKNEHDCARFKELVDCYANGSWVHRTGYVKVHWNRLSRTGNLSFENYRIKHTACDDQWAAATNGTGTFGPTAEAQAAAGQPFNINPIHRYHWEPTDTLTCPYRDFDREAFCRKLGPGHSMVILGDSISQMFIFSMWHHMLNNESLAAAQMAYPNWNTTSDGYPVCMDIFEQPVVIRLWRNHFLEGTEMFDVFRAWNMSSLVVNKGAHFRQDTDFVAGLETFLEEFRRQFPDTLMVWRDTPPGHVNCTENAFEVLKEPQDPELLPFNWGKFAHQNDLARPIVERYGGVYMGVASSTALQIGGHLGRKSDNVMDCLHYCVPGPADHWVTRLFNIMSLLL